MKPSLKDRRYAGVLLAGLHSHFALGSTETRLGVDLVAFGPQTGVGALHCALHQLFGMPPPDNLAAQMPNHIYPTVSTEVGKTYHLGFAHLRHFAEAQAGVGSYVGIAGDFVIGGFDKNVLMLRDQVSGQRFPGVRSGAEQGFGLTLGGDIAYVFDSAYLPGGGQWRPAKKRNRLRVGFS